MADDAERQVERLLHVLTSCTLLLRYVVPCMLYAVHNALGSCLLRPADTDHPSAEESRWINRNRSICYTKCALSAGTAHGASDAHLPLHRCRAVGEPNHSQLYYSVSTAGQ